MKVLFLCLGNICRSPLAEGVFQHLVDARGLTERITVDSAGTGGWHVDELPDRRSIATGLAHGIDIQHQRARQLAPSDFTQFDWIVAMDHTNLQTARDRAPGDATALLVAFMDYVAGAAEADVPDPYYGGDNGFEHVYGLLSRGAEPLLAAITSDPRYDG